MEQREQWQSTAACQSRQQRGWRRFMYLCLLLLLFIVAACGGQRKLPAHITPQPTATEQPQTQPQNMAAEAAAMDMLNNIKTNGFNVNASVNNGMGGLWINWRYGSSPFQTNLNGSGFADDPGQNPPRHDQLTDLRYLHALWLYKSLHKQDNQFDQEMTRYTAIVKHEFSNVKNERGWLYDLFIDLHKLSGDTFYQLAANSLANYFYTSLYHQDTGIAFLTSKDHPHGYYRADLALEQGCALIQAGHTFNIPEWERAGHRLVEEVYTTAYLPQYHLLLYQLDNALRPDGSLNTNPDIFRGLSGHTKIEGGGVRLGSVAQEALSLLHVYSVTHDHAFLDKATDMLDVLTIDNNALKLWDDQREGYYAAVIFPGASRQNPGEPRVNKNIKESGRQLQLLETFRVANAFTHDRYKAMQDVMLRLATGKAYYAPGHGILYQMTPDWQPVRLKNGQVQDWVTTEAMGIALEGLFSLSKPNPW